MRRIALTCFCLALTGCGFKTWSDWPFSTGSNPNMPVGSSENMRRVRGEDVPVEQLTPQAGDVWPGPIAPEPTLQDLEKQVGGSAPEQPVPGSPLSREATPPANPPRGSSTPPQLNQPNPPAMPAPLPSTPTPIPPPSSSPQARNPAGQVIQTQRGPGTVSGGTSGYQTLTMPGGGSAIVVPNGNGSSTVIHSDGTIETIPTPR